MYNHFNFLRLRQAV